MVSIENIDSFAGQSKASPLSSDNKYDDSYLKGSCFMTSATAPKMGSENTSRLAKGHDSVQGSL